MQGLERIKQLFMKYIIMLCFLLGLLSKSKVRYVKGNNAPKPEIIVAETDKIKSKQINCNDDLTDFEKDILREVLEQE